MTICTIRLMHYCPVNNIRFHCPCQFDAWKSNFCHLAAFVGRANERCIVKANSIALSVNNGRYHHSFWTAKLHPRKYAAFSITFHGRKMHWRFNRHYTHIELEPDLWVPYEGCWCLHCDKWAHCNCHLSVGGHKCRLPLEATDVVS